MLEEDIDQVMQIECAAYEFSWTRGIFLDCLKSGYSCWVLENQQECMLGYGIISSAVGEAHLLNLCVRPDQQGQGLGFMLAEHLIHIARSYQAETMFLEVRPSNHPALVIYNRLGFNEVGLRRNYYPAADGREDAIIMALTL